MRASLPLLPNHQEKAVHPGFSLAVLMLASMTGATICPDSKQVRIAGERSDLSYETSGHPFGAVTLFFGKPFRGSILKPAIVRDAEAEVWAFSEYQSSDEVWASCQHEGTSDYDLFDLGQRRVCRFEAEPELERAISTRFHCVNGAYPGVE
ncbi:MAG: STY0301 family protein [Lysobacterales bacterium]